MNINRLKNWLKEIFSWLDEAKLAFMCFIVLFAVFLVCFYTWQDERTIRISGYTLQFFGMVFAIQGLLNIRNHFHDETLLQKIAEWISRFPKWKKQTTVGLGSCVMRGVSSLSCCAEVWTTDNTEDAIEKRIDGIILNLNRIREEQRNHFREVNALLDDHKKNKKEQELARKNMQEKIRKDLKSLHTDDIVISLIGLIWLTIGITLSTISQEFAAIMN